MRLSIGLKIFSIALVMSVLLTAVAVYSVLKMQAYSVLKMHEIARESDVVADSYFSLIERISDSEEQVLEQEIMLERLRLLARERPRDEDAIASARDTFEQHRQQAVTHLQSTRALLDEVVDIDPSRETALQAGNLEARLELVAREHEDFTEHAEQLIAFSLTGREDARAAFADLVKAEEREFDESVSSLRHKIGEFAQKGARQARNDAENWEQLSLLLTGGAMLAGLVMAGAITIGLVRPVRRLLDGMRGVQEGNLDVTIEATSGDEIGQLTLGFNEMAKDLRAKERIKSIFGHYVDSRIVEQLIARPDLTEPGGERREMTIFFSDIVGFASISEQLTAAALVGLINGYFTDITEPIRAENGVVDKFIGDAIMAFWGPPFVPEEEHAARACRAALASLELLEEFQKKVPGLTGLRTNPPRVDIRVGIATGPALVGNVGSATQKNYTGATP